MTARHRIIYLDNAATTGWKPPGVFDAVRQSLRQPANPGRSGHALALSAAEIIYDVREALGRFFRFPQTENIILTKNATEALNIAIYGRLAFRGGHAVATAMEHNSVLRPLHHLHRHGVIDLTIVRPGGEGVITPALLRPALRDDTRLVAVTAASNVTGGLTDLAGIHQLTAAAGVPLLVDAAQAAGAMPLDLTALPCELVAVTGHKHLYGPQGTGALFVRDPGALDPVLCGGTGSLSEEAVQPDFPPDKFEAGTPNTPGLAGLRAGIEYIETAGLDSLLAKEQALARRLLDELRQLDEVNIIAPDVPRVPIVSFTIRGAHSSEIASFLDREWSICCRPGLHCSPETHRVLGTFPGGTARFSLSAATTAEEIATAVTAIKEFVAARDRH
jgi:cysteine desulfurase family protein